MRTDAGRDFQAAVMGDTGSDGTGDYAPACYIGLTADANAPAAGNTTLAGEIDSGTLVRAQGVYAHTSGTDIYTLTKTFTSDQTVTINKVGVFNDATSGVLVFETLLDYPVTLRSGDQVQITVAVTL